MVGQATDVTDAVAVQGLWDKAVAELGSVDLWINNAGVAHTTASIVDTDVDDVRTMVTTNMLGTIYGSQVAVRGMTAQPDGGQVFNILGGGSDGKIRDNMGVYSSTKRGLDLFTAALVKETKGSNVRVGQVRPGLLITDGWLREARRAPSRFPRSARSSTSCATTSMTWRRTSSTRCSPPPRPATRSPGSRPAASPSGS